MEVPRGPADQTDDGAASSRARDVNRHDGRRLHLPRVDHEIGRRDTHPRCASPVRIRRAAAGSQASGHDTNYELPIPRNKVADATGLTSVHINRTLRAPLKPTSSSNDQPARDLDRGLAQDRRGWRLRHELSAFAGKRTRAALRTRSCGDRQRGSKAKRPGDLSRTASCVIRLGQDCRFTRSFPTTGHEVRSAMPLAFRANSVAPLQLGAGDPT